MDLMKQSASLPFVENAMESVENMLRYAELLIESEMLPKHFYVQERDGNNKMVIKRDAKGKPVGKPGAVLMTVQHGREIGFSMSQSFQQLVPMDGGVTIKGDGAKMLILASGKCEKWEETTGGSREAGDWWYEIYAKRKDTGEEKRMRYSMQDAIRQGLWVSESDLKAKPQLKYSAWYRYQDRMLRYRPLGYVARDLFGDVLGGMSTYEEVRDWQEDQEIRMQPGVVTTETGATIKTPALGPKHPELNLQVDEAIGKAQAKKDKLANLVEPKEDLAEYALINEEPEAPIIPDGEILPMSETTRTNEEIKAFRVKLAEEGFALYKDCEPLLKELGYDIDRDTLLGKAPEAIIVQMKQLRDAKKAE